MKNITRHVGMVEGLHRMPNSKNGNPRWLAYIAGFWCRTPVDSQLGYTLPNFANKKVCALIGTHYGFATLKSIELAD